LEIEIENIGKIIDFDGKFTKFENYIARMSRILDSLVNTDFEGRFKEKAQKLYPEKQQIINELNNSITANNESPTTESKAAEKEITNTILSYMEQGIFIPKSPEKSPEQSPEQLRNQLRITLNNIIHPKPSFTQDITVRRLNSVMQYIKEGELYPQATPQSIQLIRHKKIIDLLCIQYSSVDRYGKYLKEVANILDDSPIQKKIKGTIDKCLKQLDTLHSNLIQKLQDNESQYKSLIQDRDIMEKATKSLNNAPKIQRLDLKLSNNKQNSWKEYTFTGELKRFVWYRDNETKKLDHAIAQAKAKVYKEPEKIQLYDSVDLYNPKEIFKLKIKHDGFSVDMPIKGNPKNTVEIKSNHIATYMKNAYSHRELSGELEKFDGLSNWIRLGKVDDQYSEKFELCPVIKEGIEEKLRTIQSQLKPKGVLIMKELINKILNEGKDLDENVKKQLNHDMQYLDQLYNILVNERDNPCQLDTENIQDNGDWDRKNVDIWSAFHTTYSKNKKSCDEILKDYGFSDQTIDFFSKQAKLMEEGSKINDYRSLETWWQDVIKENKNRTEDGEKFEEIAEKLSQDFEVNEKDKKISNVVKAAVENFVISRRRGMEQQLLEQQNIKTNGNVSTTGLRRPPCI
jgi:hypothetical protein